LLLLQVGPQTILQRSKDPTIFIKGGRGEAAVHDVVVHDPRDCAFERLRREAGFMRTMRTLLLVEDNAGDARLLREMLDDQGAHNITLTHVKSMTDAETYLATNPVDVILLDLGLPDAQGLEGVLRARKAAPRVPLVVLTGLDDESLASQALKSGAQAYLVKGEMEMRPLLRALRDAVERYRIEEALFAEAERAHVALNSITDGVLCTDLKGNVTFLNAVAERLTGWMLPEAEGKPASEVLQILDTISRTPPNPMKLWEQNQPVRLPPNCILVRRDGHEVPIEDSVSPMHDRMGEMIGTVVVLRDVSATRALELRIAHSAEHDDLTGLPNRILLNDRLGQAISTAKRNVKQVAVLFLDLDGFKHVNDSLGHAVGDRLLQSVAKRLVQCMGPSDTVSRQGGDEFVVMLSHVEHNSEDATHAAARMLKAVAQPHAIGQHELHVTTSIGVSVYPDDGQDAGTLIKNADTAMYQAKDHGRQSYQFFTPAMNVRAVERQSIEESLRRALERKEFALHYQPKIDLTTGEITGAEALLRWTHPALGSVPPAQFIPIAEASGLILPISAWVLREACQQARAWVDSGLPIMSMAVNICAMEFQNENFLDNLFATLRETGLDPKSLELELTEGVLMKHAASAAAILQSARDRGVQVAVDDFGTGYSSLSYLRKLPVDALKIDQSFVSEIGAGEDTTIVTAVIGMARGLKLRVVAEGVETQEQMAFLQAQHCEEAQGYYFSRPVPPEQFARLLRTGIPERDRVRRGAPGSERRSALARA
jgi:diguanylate cyclase (GGDEF)-like protein/PAS domain S-box-containing protein